MIGALCLIFCGALSLYRANKEGYEKMAKPLKIIGGISIAAGVIMGFALLVICNY